MAGVNLPLAFGALVAGAVIVDYGVKNTKQAFASTGSSTGSTGGVSAGPGQYVAPIDPAKAKLERTDQGVDISAPPGTPVRALGNSKVIGRIENWYAGQPFVWFQLLDGPDAGKYWYAAEQIDFNIHPGDKVQAGEQIGTIARSGTGTEWGWATADGQTLARATTGYVEGVATAAGEDFHKLTVSLGL